METGSKAEMADQATLVLGTRSKREMMGAAKGEIREVGRTGARVGLDAEHTARTGVSYGLSDRAQAAEEVDTHVETGPYWNGRWEDQGQLVTGTMTEMVR